MNAATPLACTSSAGETSRKGVLALWRASLCGFSIKLSRGAAQDFSSLWGMFKICAKRAGY
jgi:hypothetical protein